MGWLDWVVLSAIILLTAALFYLKRQAKPKASDGNKHEVRASQPQHGFEGSKTDALRKFETRRANSVSTVGGANGCKVSKVQANGAMAVASAQGDWERTLIEARLGVTMKRMFSTGPEAFDHYLGRFQDDMLKSHGEAPWLRDTVTALAFAMDAWDHYTQEHSKNVSQIAVKIAQQMGLTESFTEEVRIGGLLHDLGMIGVPACILNKPSLLTPEEFEIVKTHASKGAKILEPLKIKAIERIRGMVRNHHEAFDGSGYPDGLKGEDISLGARIVAVAESFDAIVSKRKYKSGRSVEDAVSELRRCSGTQFDPEVVEAFLAVQPHRESGKARTEDNIPKVQGTPRGQVEFSMELSSTAAPELGLLPTMTVGEAGIVITREDDGNEVPTYTFTPPSKWPKERLAEFAADVFAVKPLTGKWLVEAGFKIAFGAQHKT